MSAEMRLKRLQKYRRTFLLALCASGLLLGLYLMGGLWGRYPNAQPALWWPLGLRYYPVNDFSLTLNYCADTADTLPQMDKWYEAEGYWQYMKSGGGRYFRVVAEQITPLVTVRLYQDVTADKGTPIQRIEYAWVLHLLVGDAARYRSP